MHSMTQILWFGTASSTCTCAVVIRGNSGTPARPVDLGSICTGNPQPACTALPIRHVHVPSFAGRAGRDGLPADCILFYSYADRRTIESMLEEGVRKGETSEQVRKMHQAALDAVTEFCENMVECRRRLVLAHFGEEFSRAACAGTCDNCKRGAHACRVDCTAEAIAFCAAVGQRDGAATQKQLAGAYVGSLDKRTASGAAGFLMGTPLWDLAGRMAAAAAATPPDAPPLIAFAGQFRVGHPGAAPSAYAVAVGSSAGSSSGNSSGSGGSLAAGASDIRSSVREATGKAPRRDDGTRIVQWLIRQQLLTEISVANAAGFSTARIWLTPQGRGMAAYGASLQAALDSRCSGYGAGSGAGAAGRYGSVTLTASARVLVPFVLEGAPAKAAAGAAAAGVAGRAGGLAGGEVVIDDDDDDEDAGGAGSDDEAAARAPAAKRGKTAAPGKGAGTKGSAARGKAAKGAAAAGPVEDAPVTGRKRRAAGTGAGDAGAGAQVAAAGAARKGIRALPAPRPLQAAQPAAGTSASTSADSDDALAPWEVPGSSSGAGALGAPPAARPRDHHDAGAGLAGFAYSGTGLAQPTPAAKASAVGAAGAGAGAGNAAKRQRTSELGDSSERLAAAVPSSTPLPASKAAARDLGAGGDDDSILGISLAALPPVQGSSLKERVMARLARANAAAATATAATASAVDGLASSRAGPGLAGNGATATARNVASASAARQLVVEEIDDSDSGADSESGTDSGSDSSDVDFVSGPGSDSDARASSSDGAAGGAGRRSGAAGTAAAAADARPKHLRQARLSLNGGLELPPAPASSKGTAIRAGDGGAVNMNMRRSLGVGEVDSDGFAVLADGYVSRIPEVHALRMHKRLKAAVAEGIAQHNERAKGEHLALITAGKAIPGSRPKDLLPGAYLTGRAGCVPLVCLDYQKCPSPCC